MPELRRNAVVVWLLYGCCIVVVWKFPSLVRLRSTEALKWAIWEPVPHSGSPAIPTAVLTAVSAVWTAVSAAKPAVSSAVGMAVAVETAFVTTAVYGELRTAHGPQTQAM